MSSTVAKKTTDVEKTNDLNIKITTDKIPFSCASYNTLFETVGGMAYQILSSVFSDFKGIEFDQYQNGQIRTILTFVTGNVPEDGKKVRAFEPETIAAGSNIAYAVASITSYASRKKKNHLTKEGKEVLANLIWCNKVEDIRWEDNFNEVQNQVIVGGRPYTQDEIKFDNAIDFGLLLRFIKFAGIDDLQDIKKYNVEYTLHNVPRVGSNVLYPNLMIKVTIHNIEEYDKFAVSNNIGIAPQMVPGGRMITSAAYVK